MKSLIALCLACLPLRAEKLDFNRMVRVQSALEGGKESDLGGPAHISYAAWSDHTRHAYQLSKTKEKAENIYRLHLAWIVNTLEGHGEPPSPHNLAVVWRRGMTEARSRKFRDEYGTRASNLYYDKTFK